MRILCAALAASLFVTAAAADTLAAGALAPGRPAGVKPAARLSGWDQAILIGTGAVIMAGVGILASGQSSALGSTKIESNAIPFQPSNTVVSTGSTV